MVYTPKQLWACVQHASPHISLIELDNLVHADKRPRFRIAPSKTYGKDHQPKNAVVIDVQTDHPA
jgi:hypothetical protein